MSALLDLPSLVTAAVVGTGSSALAAWRYLHHVRGRVASLEQSRAETVRRMDASDTLAASRHGEVMSQLGEIRGALLGGKS